MITSVVWPYVPKMVQICPAGRRGKGVKYNVQLGDFFSFLRAKAECFARLCHRLGVCLSVCLSHSWSVYICVKTVQARITKSSLWAAPRSLVYSDKISCHWVQGFPSNEGVKEGPPLKRRHFAVIGSNNVKTVADRYIHADIITSTGDRLFGFININDLERLLSSSKRGF